MGGFANVGAVTNLKVCVSNVGGFAFSLFFLKVGWFCKRGRLYKCKLFSNVWWFCIFDFLLLKVGGFANVGAFTHLNVFLCGWFCFSIFS